MNKSKLVQILKTLSEKEWQDFEKFIASPFFNKGRNYLPLLKELKKFRPDFSNPKLTKQYVYARLYEDRKYNDNTLKQNVSGLLGLAKEFLIQAGMGKDSFEREIFLLREYSSRKINTMYENEFKIAAESANEIEKQIKLADLNFNYYLLNALMKEYSQGIIECNDLDTINFVINLLQSPVIYNTIEEQFNVSSHGNLMELLLKNLNLENFVGGLGGYENKFKDELIFYYYMYKSETEPSNTENFIKARDIYYKIFNTLTHHDKFNYFRFLESYLIRQRRKGGININWGGDRQYELSKYILERNIYSFSPEQYMPPSTLFNIFFMSVHSEDYVFSAEIINRHLLKIQPEFQHNVKVLLSAYYSFVKKEYNKAMGFLSEIKPFEKDFWQLHYKMELRNLKIMIYFELNYYENLFSEIDSYRHFLKSSRDCSEEYKKPYLSLINDCEKILKAKLDNRDEGTLELMDRLKKSDTSRNFYNRWLLSKAEEILK